MATIRSVERQIRNLEGFDVRFLHGRDGRDVRSDRARVPGYHYARKLSGDKRVSEWIEGRFRRSYPGFDVEVLHANHGAAHGQTLLRTVRAEYE